MRKIVRNLIIPAGVAKEISEYGQNKIGAIDLSSESWIRIETVRSEQQVRLLLSSLDRGEAEVIALALEQKAKLVLIDELSGRYIAESLGINIAFLSDSWKNFSSLFTGVETPACIPVP